MQIVKNSARPGKRLEVVNLLRHDGCQDDAQEIREGLAQSPRTLPCKYFYDAEGSRLFDAICQLPEYYLTRLELALLQQEAARIMDFFARQSGDLVELGSGSNRKIKLLLDAAVGCGSRIRYVPVDISASALMESAQELLYLYEQLHILGLIADFTRSLAVLPSGPKLITFLGSTIGNFSRQSRLTFLENLAAAMNPADRFLLGLDMVKEPAVIEAAYNDRQGITAAFNKNILRHLNTAWDGDFKPEDFEHLARYDQISERVEMYLRSTGFLTARLAALDLTVSLDPGEVFLTETCQKFRPDAVRQDFQAAGLAVEEWFTDARGWFALVLLKKR